MAKRALPDTAAGHPYNYYWRADTPLRPPPPRLVEASIWDYNRDRLYRPRLAHLENPHELPIVRLLADHEWQGDELMDAWVAEARTIGNGPARLMFTQALDHGIDTVENPPAALTRLFAEGLDARPAWFDPKAFERGRQLWCDCSYLSRSGMAVLDLMGTFVGAEVSTAVGETGRLVRDPYRRNLETFEFFLEVSKPGGMRRFGKGFTTTTRVRLMHAQVRARLSRSWSRDRYAEHGNPISTALTATAGITIGLLPMLLDDHYGRRKTDRQMTDVLHYWTYINYVLGVAPELFTLDLTEALAMSDYSTGHAGGPTAWTEQMARAAADNIAGARGKRGTLVRAVTVPTLGAVATFSGDVLVRELTRNTSYADVRLQPWKSLFEVALRANVRTRAATDRLPGKSVRRRAVCRLGDTTSLAAVQLGRHLAKENRVPMTNYSGHDSEEPQRCPMA